MVSRTQTRETENCAAEFMPVDETCQAVMCIRRFEGSCPKFFGIEKSTRADTTYCIQSTPRLVRQNTTACAFTVRLWWLSVDSDASNCEADNDQYVIGLFNRCSHLQAQPRLRKTPVSNNVVSPNSFETATLKGEGLNVSRMASCGERGRAIVIKV